MFTRSSFRRIGPSTAQPVGLRSCALGRRSQATWAVIVLGSALAVAPSAFGATAFTLSPVGQKPGIAVDAQGRGHVAFHDTTGPLPDVVGYCRVPRATSGCSGFKSFGPEGDDGIALHGNVHVFERAGTVDVLYGRCCGPDRVLLKRSLDGGVTFQLRQLLATASDVASPDDAAYGPGNAYSWIDNSDAAFQSAVPGAPAVTSADLFTSGQAHASTVGLHGDVPVVVYQDFSSANPRMDFFWRQYDGSGSTNDATNWTARRLVAAGSGRLSEARLAEGPRGLFLATIEGPALNERLLVRKFTGSGFGSPTVVSTEAAEGSMMDLHQDASGRLHALWATSGDGRAGARGVLRWRTSTDGVNWGSAHTLSVGEDHAYMRVAAAADGKGFAVWTNSQGVRMVPLEPLPTGGGPVPDTVAPATTGLSVSDSTLRPGQSVTFRFRASEPGRALLVIDRAVAGLKLKAKGRRRASCLVETKKRLASLRKQLAKRGDVKRLRGGRREKKLRALVKKRRCAPWKKMATLPRRMQAGENSIFFSGKVDSRALKPGRYRAVLIVADAAGNLSRKQVVKFRVLAKRRGR